ncbi:MAG: PhnD/SsuA/transferrin family substrate-binding protein [Magnetospirillum sp.]|nr:PhnD/SsuA/transferrin family substrate-binding protein [Magnetospirillum sp.]
MRIGVLAFRGAERAAGEWEPTLRHLAVQLPEYRLRAVPLDLGGLAEAVRTESVDFVITNPGQYVELEAAFGIVRIASLAAAPDALPARMVASAVVARAARQDLRRLDDVRGTRLAAVAPEAFGGYRVAWRELAERGIDPGNDTAELVFMGFPMERIVDAVASGDADVGIVRACLLEQMAAEGRLRLEDFRVLDARLTPGSPCQVSTRAYPDWPFAKLAHTSDRLAKRVALALLAMPGTEGYAWTVPVDYQPVHELFRALKLGPYEYLRHRSLSQILHDNWPWLVIASLAALWWVVHVARVEYLVRRRTEDLKAAHEEARRHREEMEHGARLALLGEMASSLAHEINQPLAAIANYASGCQRRLAAGTDPEGVADGVLRIAGQAERAAGIVKRMRAFVRKRVPEPQILDLAEPVRDALGLFQASAARRGIAVTARLPTGLPPVRADRIQMEQVVLNLLQNAADAMAGLATRRLTMMVGAGEGGVGVAVADTGPGLSPEARQHLFEPFFTTKPEGLGLGLSLSRTIVEAHGGRLWAEDGAEGGAVFRFTLPVADAEALP